MTQLEDQLNHLLAIRAITSTDVEEEPDDQQWHLGLLLHQQWLHDQGKTAINELQTVRRTLLE